MPTEPRSQWSPCPECSLPKDEHVKGAAAAHFLGEPNPRCKNVIGGEHAPYCPCRDSAEGDLYFNGERWVHG